MSADSSGLGKPDAGSSPGSSKPVAGDVTEGNVDSACTSQTHSTIHGTQCETNPNLTGESNMSTPAQAQSKGETSKNDRKLADDKEKGEKNQITAIEQIEKPHLKEMNIQTVETDLESTEGVFVDDDAMQGDQDHNSPRNKYQYKHFLEEKGKVPNAKPSAGQHVGQHNGGGNINSKEVVTDVVPSTLLDRKSNFRDDTTTMSHANSSNQVDGITLQADVSNPEDVIKSQANSSNQVDGTTSQSDIANLGDGPTTSQADISNLRVGATTSHAEDSNLRVGATTSQADNSNLGVGSTTSQANIANLGDGSTTSQADISNLRGGATTSQADISNLGDGPTTSQADITNLGDGPTTSQADNSNVRVGATTSQADNSNLGDGSTTSQANYLNIGDGPTTSHTDNINPEDVIKSQANSSNQVDGTTSQSDIANLGDGATTSHADDSNLGDGPTTSQADISNLRDNPTTSQADIANVRVGATTSQADIANLGDGPTTSQADISNLRVGATTSQADISNLGDGPTTSQADNSNVRVGTTTSQADIANLGDGQTTSQANYLNIGDGPTTSHTDNLNPEDVIKSQVNSSNQVDGTTSQADNVNQGDDPTTSQADISNPRVGATTSQADIANLGDGPTTLQADIANLRVGATTSQADIANLGVGSTASQVDNLNLRVGATKSQADIANLGDGPTTSQADNSNVRVGATTSQADIANLGDGQTTSQANYLNKGDGPTTSHTDNLNPEDVMKSQANSSNQVDGTTSQTDNLNQGDGPTTLQADIANIRVGATTSQADIANVRVGATTSQADIANIRVGATTSQADISNLRVGATTSQADNSNLRVGATTSQADNSNLGDGPTTSHTDNLNQGDGTTSQADNSNIEDHTTKTSQANNANQGNGPISLQADIANLGNVTTTSQVDNSNPGDVTTSTSQANNSKQTEGDNPNQEQAENQDQRDGMTSVLRNWDSNDTGAADNTEKVENNESSKLQAGELDKRDVSQSYNQVTDYPNGQSEEGVTRSEHPPIPFFFSQSQDDFTVIEHQLEKIIDDILTDSTLYENEEDWKKKSKKKIKGFLFTKLEDGTMSQRSLHPNVTHTMPVQNVDSGHNFADACKPHDENDQKPPGRSTSSIEEFSQAVPEDSLDGKRKRAPNSKAREASFSQSYSPKMSTACISPRPISTLGPSALGLILESRADTSCDMEKGMIGMQHAQEVGPLLNRSLTTVSSKRMSSEPTSKAIMDSKRNAEEIKIESLLSSTDDSSNRPVSVTEGTKKLSRKNYIFVLDPGTKLNGEEWELHVVCAFPEIYKMIYIFSSDSCKSHAKEQFNRVNILLNDIYIPSLNIVRECIKPMSRMKLDQVFIHDIISVCDGLLSTVDVTKLTMHANIDFEQITHFCKTRHLACKNSAIHLFHDEEKKDEFWVVVEKADKKLCNSVVDDLHDHKMATRYSTELENHDLSGYFVQKADLNEIDVSLFRFLKRNKSFAERYKDVNVSQSGRQVLILDKKEIQKDLFKKVRDDISALSRSKQSFSVSPSLRTLLNNHEVVEYVNRTVNAEHDESVFWTLVDHVERSYIEIYGLQYSVARIGRQTILGCFKEKEFDITKLQREAFQLPVLEGERFRGKIAQTDMKNNRVRIFGTNDIFDEYIDILEKEIERLKKPSCKTVEVGSRNVLRFCETHLEVDFMKWKKSVEIDAVFKDGKCGFTIKGSAEKVEIVGNELKQILSDVIEVQFEEKKTDIMDLTENRQFRIQRYEIEKEWDVDTIVDGVPSQHWSIRDGLEWRFENGPSHTLLIVKSALPVDVDVVLQPFPKDNVLGKHRSFENHLIGDWYKSEFEAEFGDSGKAKDSFRKSLKTALLEDIKGRHFQTLVFPVEQKIMERIGWSLTHYLKQILFVLHEDFSFEPWSLFFLCENKDELETCTQILETNFKGQMISKSDVRIKCFPLQDNVKPAITIEVKQGSLVKTKADVIVNTTYKDLKSLKHGFVSKSVLDAAGSELSNECKKMYPNGIEYCEVAVTPSFQLKQCKKIYHGGIPFFNKSLKPLKDFVRNCLIQATDDRMQTIAFPAIGTGNLKYPVEDVAETMINTVHEFSDKCPTTLQSVFFVIFDDKTLQEFKKKSKTKHTVAASDTQTTIGSDKVTITVVGTSDRANTASRCLHDFIKQFKEKKDEVITKQDEVVQPSTSKVGTASKKSVAEEDTSTSVNKRKNVPIDGENLRLILKKKATQANSNLEMSECRKHLNGFKYKKIICPFGNGYIALVKFETQEDVDEVLTKLKSADYTFDKLPEQAVSNVKAKLCKEMIHFLRAKDVTEEEIEDSTGAKLDKIEWKITGCLVEIKQAEDFLKQLLSGKSEPRKSLLQTSMPHKEPEACATDMHEKKKICCSISEWKAMKFFHQDVAAKLYDKLDPDGFGYKLSGNREAIEEFSNTLDSMFSKTLENVNQVFYEIAAKRPGVYCHFINEEKRLEMYAKTQEKLDFIEELIKTLNKKECRQDKKKEEEKVLDLQSIEYIKTSDKETVQNEEQFTMEADDFDTVCHFNREFSTKFIRRDEENKVILTGSKSLVKRLRNAQQDIQKNFFNESIVLGARGNSRVYDVYEQMTEAPRDVHTRILKSGSNIIIVFTGKNQKEVCRMKSWFEDELKKKKKTSGKQSEVKYKPFSTAQKDCLIFQKGKLKIYALNKDILEECADAIVCPSNLHVGQKIKTNAGVSENINEKILGEAITITEAPELGTGILLLHTRVPSWAEYANNENPCEKCIDDIGSIIHRCLSAGCNRPSIAFPEFVSDKVCQLPAVICCSAFAKGVKEFLKYSQNSKALTIYYVDNNPVTTNLLRRCFMQELNWEYTADDKYSIFFLNSAFQVHVKQAEVFQFTAYAVAASQDRDMKNERFVANQLYKYDDKKYKSELSGMKLDKHPKITNAPHGCAYVKVIHFLSPNWRNKNVGRDVLLKAHSESMTTLMDFALHQQCSSIVIPLSGGHYTDWETRKKIAESTALVVAEWCKDNAKKFKKLETIYFLHNDSSYITTAVECLRRQNELLYVSAPGHSTLV